MVINKNIEKLKNSLDSDEAIKKFKEDPLTQLQTLGYDFSKVDDKYQKQLKDYIQKLDFSSLNSSKKIEMETPGGWFACAACKVGIGATITGVATAIIAICVAAIIGTGGEAAAEEAAIVPELETGTGAAEVAIVSAEAGISSKLIVKIFAGAFAAGGAAEFIGLATNGVCNATGDCTY